MNEDASGPDSEENPKQSNISACTTQENQLDLSRKTVRDTESRLKHSEGSHL